MNPKFYTAYFWLSSILSALCLGYLIYKYILAARNRPLIQKGDITYQDWFASGYSMRNVLTRLGGARGVLRLVVTRRLLWVTSWFPFSLIAPFYDLEHVIPLERITKVEANVGLMSRWISVSYASDDGEIRSLKLAPKDEAGFLRALGR